MTVSIVIVNYNTALLTKRCVDSVLKALDYSGDLTGEILLIDNASTDGSGQKLQEEYEGEPRVKVMQSLENGGMAAAYNIGLRNAQGEFLLLLDSDTIVQTDTVKKSVGYLKNHPAYGAMGCKVQLPNGKLDPSCKRSFPTPLTGAFHSLKLDRVFPRSRLFAGYNLTYLDEDTTAEVDSVSGAFMLVRREVYESVGGFDEDYYFYGEDIDWCYRMMQAGYRVVYHPETAITHFKAASWDEKDSPAFVNAFYDSMLLFYDKHYRERYGVMTNTAVKAGTGILKGLANLRSKLK